MPENPPLQRRAGFNRGLQSQNLLQVRNLGQPAIKAGPGDTVLFKNSPDTPGAGRGQKNFRAQMNTLYAVSGVMFNRTGGDVEVELVLVDPDGNEFPYKMNDFYGSATIPNGENMPLLQLSLLLGISTTWSWPVSVLLPNWSIVLRVVSGNPTAGKGLIVWPWSQDVSTNLQAQMVKISNTEVELGPEPGRAWQLCGKQALQYRSGAPVYLNFDSIERGVSKETYFLAGENIQVNVTRPPIVLNPRNFSAAYDEGISPGFMTEYGEDMKPKGLVLAYPDKIKVQGREAQKTAPLYMFITFAEFDLPSDMNVEG